MSKNNLKYYRLATFIVIITLLVFNYYEIALVTIGVFGALDFYTSIKYLENEHINNETLEKILKNELNELPKSLTKYEHSYEQYKVFYEKIFSAIKNIQNSRMVEKILIGEEKNELVQLILEVSDIVEYERQDFLHQKVELLSKNKDLELAQKFLEDKSVELEELTKHKSRFLANMSHEFRTPLNAIINFSSFALEEEDSEEQINYIENIRKSSQHLLGIINDVLDLASIEAGSFSLIEENFNLSKKVNFVVDLAKSIAKVKGIDIIAYTDTNIPNSVYGDSRRFTQALINLISNSVKFNKKDGAIIISISASSIENKEIKLNVEITDTGKGMSKDFQEVMFKPFSQADESHKRCHEGTGLGLSITAHILKLMKGDINITSKEGIGTQFKLNIPFVIKGKETTKEEENYLELINKKLSILVAEDNLVNQKIINKIISKANHDVKIVSNGSEAVDEFKTNEFDLILMDIQMPNMDGLEASKIIIEHEKESQKNHVPIIAFTAHALKQEKERYLKHGMDGYVTKPVNPSLLWKEIYRVTNKET